MRSLLLVVSLVAAARSGLAIDCNGNGRDDLADIADGFSEDCNENGIPDGCEGAPFGFTTGQTEYPVAPTRQEVRSADIDGDGDLDLIVGSRAVGGASTISVLFNRGDRTFVTAEHDGGTNLYYLSLGDLDGDGDLDLVTANTDELVVFMNAGDGGFERAGRQTPARSTRIVTVGDVSGDGVADLVTADRNARTISVYPGEGDGTFAAGTGFEVGNNPAEIALADFDSDGDLDLATVNVTSRDLSVLINDGSGAFAAPLNHSLGRSPPTGVKVADLDGDDVPDLVAGTETSIRVLLGNGDGTFAAPAIYFSEGRALTPGDFDADGDLDLAVGSQPEDVTVRLNDGAGGFGQVAEFPVDELPTILVAGDFDQDGGLDLVMKGNVSILTMLWNGETERLSLTTEVVAPLVGCVRENGCRPHSGTVGDLDGDGDLDVIGANTHPGSFAILLNDGAGNMKVQPAITFGGEHPQSVATGDLDGDGTVDAVTVDNLEHDLWVHLNEGGDGDLRLSGRFPVGLAPINVKLADFDGDGDLDAASANQDSLSVSVLFNDGQARFSAPRGQRDYRVMAGPKAVEAVDLDGDGDVDLAVANSSAVFVSILLGEGDGTFAPAVSYRLSTSANHVVSGDLDRDGDLDLVIASSVRTGSVFALLNHGDGTFARAMEFAVGQSLYSVATLDVNGDGALDVATANEASSTVSFLRGVGDGTFGEPLHVSAGRSMGLRFVVPGDFDADGDMDLVSTNREGRSFTMFYNQATVEAGDYLERICTPLDFHKLSATASPSSAADRFTKYTVAASPGAQMRSTVYQNTKLFPLHEEFLETIFPNFFPALDPLVYDSLVGRRATRQYFVGSVSRIRVEGGRLYGFSIFARFDDPAERLTAEEVKGVHDRLRETFRLEPFAYYPNTRAAVEVAEEWDDPGFELYFDRGGRAAASYEPYTRAAGYGRVRILEEDEFAAANETGGLSFQDVLVLERAPRDIEGVVGGVITAEPQGELSHVAVRTNRRGTPNAFVKNALEVFGPHEGQLVRLEVGETTYEVEPATEAQAESFWEHNRPELAVDPTVDREFGELSDLEEIAAMAAGGVDVEARFGGKASNLARLQTILVGEWASYRLKGFAIPARYYLEFVDSSELPSALDPGRRVTYGAYLEELFADDRFNSDSTFRFEALRVLRDDIEERGQVPAELVDRLAARIGEVYDHLPADHRVRFRSSSNIEDAIEFNGAGLYDSTSVCALDDLDDDGSGPSLCDATERSERGIVRGLRRVWASLWNFRAYEERAFYGIDQGVAAMGILSNKTFVDERANGVAFTGNPANPLDRRYVVTVQPGEASVVSPDPGVLPEKDVLEMADGDVVHIIRAVPSSLVADGEFVLSDDELRELGRLMWHIDHNFPIDTGNHPREDVLLDLEFKIEAGGALAVKQVRPFLLTNPAPPALSFALEIPGGAVACGIFGSGRTPRGEYELKSQLHFASGSFVLPTGVNTRTETIVRDLVIGHERLVATADGPGLFRLEKVPGGAGAVHYHFSYEQAFVLPGGERVELTISEISFEARDGVPVEPVLLLDADALTDRISMTTSFRQDGGIVDIFYTSCQHDTLPRWEIRAELADGNSIFLEERYRPELTRDFGPASLQRAELVLGARRHVVRDYWKLVYSATRHNLHAVYRAVLEPPVTVPGIEALVRAVELAAPIPTDDIFDAKARYLGVDFEVLASVEVPTYSKEEVAAPLEGLFRRGDVDGDGGVSITDGLSLLGYLFQQGAPSTCLKAGDANDDGRLNLSDGVQILLHLFAGGGPLPDPFGECGVDPTVDDIPCGSSGCE